MFKEKSATHNKKYNMHPPKMCFNKIYGGVIPSHTQTKSMNTFMHISCAAITTVLQYLFGNRQTNYPIL